MARTNEMTNLADVAAVMLDDNTDSTEACEAEKAKDGKRAASAVERAVVVAVEGTSSAWFWIALFGAPATVILVEGGTRALRSTVGKRRARRALKGRRICISGRLGKTRDEIVKLIEDAGGTFHDTIKSDTTHLLTNADWTKNSINGKGSSKLDKARRWGVRIISEKEFFAMLTAADAAQAAKRES